MRATLIHGSLIVYFEGICTFRCIHIKCLCFSLFSYFLKALFHRDRVHDCLINITQHTSHIPIF